MNGQNISNHSRYSTGYHIILLGLLLAGIAGSIVNMNNAAFNLGPKLILLLFVCVLLTAYFARAFALKAQDRAIRAEENLRYFILSGKLPDQRLTMPQFTALRFASDDELIALAEKAVAENLSSAQIKKLIVSWRGDYYRV